MEIENADIVMLETVFKNGINQFKVFERGLDVMTTFRNLKGVEEETRKRLSAMKNEMAGIDERLTESKREADTIIRDASLLAENLEKEAAVRVSDAEDIARNIIEKANQKADLVREKSAAVQIDLEARQEQLKSVMSSLEMLRSEETSLRNRLHELLKK